MSSEPPPPAAAPASDAAPAPPAAPEAAPAQPSTQPVSAPAAAAAVAAPAAAAAAAPPSQELLAAIQRQVEYYFSVKNLPRGVSVCAYAHTHTWSDKKRKQWSDCAFLVADLAQRH